MSIKRKSKSTGKYLQSNNEEALFSHRLRSIYSCLLSTELEVATVNLF